MKIAPIIALAAALAAPFASAQTPPAAQPEGWTVAGTGVGCSVVRAGEDGGGVRLAVSAIPGTWSFGLAFFNTVLNDRGAGPRRGVEIELEPGGRTIPGLSLIPIGGANEGFLTSPGIADTHLDSLAAAARLRLHEGGDTLLDLPVPGLDRAVAALRRCIADRLRAWDIDPERHAALRARPKAIGGVSTWLSPDDYPEGARRLRRSGTTMARLTIGPDGWVGACAAVVSSGDRDLDARTCAVLASRGRYQPALDANGRPTQAMVIARVDWRLP